MTIMRRLSLVLAIAAVAAAITQPAAGHRPRVVVVVGGRAAENPAAVARARAAVEGARGAEVQLRVPRTPTEELAVTHFFAVAGYDEIVAVDLDRRVAIAPVARKFPRVRFVTAGPAALSAAVADEAG
jgi:hypothetical protein